jgi:ubiquitin carboxyl-terminal hydrolase 8
MNKFDKYKNKGLSGLANLGNSCYINSCMQIISHTYELNNILEDGKYKRVLNEISDSVITLEWDKLRELLWNANCVVAPYGFIKSVRKIAEIKDRDIFIGSAQNDLPEFLLFIIDCFHTSIARKVDMQISGNSQNSTDELAKICYGMMKQMYNKEYSELLELFYGIHVSELSHITTGDVLSLTPEPFSVLNLPIPSNNPNPTIYDCFDLYCSKEVLMGDEAWKNEKTEAYQDVNRRILFWSLPNIMIIDLKRWTNYKNKNQIYVEAPLTNADFSKYVKGYHSNSYVYELYGVCNHIGGMLGGHYTAYIKNANEKWYEFNDTSVREISENSVISSYSYCFFYRKKVINK